MADDDLKQKDKRYREGFFSKIANRVLVVILIAISYLPFRVLFGVSDLFYLILRYIVRYRHNVIAENLAHAFPEKNKKELEIIINKFYHHFCDLFVETIKSYSMGTKQMKKRMKFTNIEVLNGYFNKGKSVVLLGMHHNNWEWNSILPETSNHKIVVLYNPMRGNESFEKFLLKLRSRWGCEFVPVHKSRRLVFNIAKMETPVVLALGADQAAPANSKFWTTFFNREAPFFSGPEIIATYSNLPVFLHHVRKVKRGYYEVEFTLLFENPKEVEPKEILLTYIRKMEEIVREEPAYYLWSHRRWKHTRPKNIQLTVN